jgi:hypothetical protein
MSLDPEFPLSVIREALRTIIGWTVAVLSVALLGIGAGLWLGSNRFPLDVVMVLFLVCPPALIACCTTGIIWLVFLAMDIESTNSRLVALGVLLMIWVAVGFWIGRFF